MTSTTRSTAATLRAAIAEATSNRAAFAFQATVMILNDLAWVGFWVIFFHKTGTVKGWNTSEVLLLQAVLTGAGGLTLGFLANSRHLSKLISDGALDSALALPVHPLAFLLVRRFDTTAVGDVLFGTSLFLVAGHPSVERTIVFVGGTIVATVLLTSFLVFVGSLTFFTGRSDGADMGFNSILVLSGYPVDLFGGSSKFFLYTIVPAAFVATVPARLIQHFDIKSATEMLMVTTLFVIAAVFTFRLGLRRYASGSVWTRA